MNETPQQVRMNELLLQLMDEVNALAFKILGNKVIGGPFVGMEIPEIGPWHDGNSSTKLIGSYEFELHAPLKRALDRQPKFIVNIGCAEGYYAVGMALSAPEAKIWASDINLDCLEMCRTYAKRNGVSSQVTCGTEIPLGGDLYVVDVEGAETEVLKDPQMFLKSDIIVECHDFMKPGTSEVLAREFADTHEVETIIPRLPPFGDYQFLAASPTVMTLLVVAEKRPMPTRWLACWSKEKTNG